jgi:hypothetical protein
MLLEGQVKENGSNGRPVPLLYQLALKQPKTSSTWRCFSGLRTLLVTLGKVVIKDVSFDKRSVPTATSLEIYHISERGKERLVGPESWK